MPRKQQQAVFASMGSRSDSSVSDTGMQHRREKLAREGLSTESKQDKVDKIMQNTRLTHRQKMDRIAKLKAKPVGTTKHSTSVSIVRVPSGIDRGAFDSIVVKQKLPSTNLYDSGNLLLTQEEYVRGTKNRHSLPKGAKILNTPPGGSKRTFDAFMFRAKAKPNTYIRDNNLVLPMKDYKKGLRRNARVRFGTRDWKAKHKLEQDKIIKEAKKGFTEKGISPPGVKAIYEKALVKHVKKKSHYTRVPAGSIIAVQGVKYSLPHATTSELKDLKRDTTPNSVNRGKINKELASRAPRQKKLKAEIKQIKKEAAVMSADAHERRTAKFKSSMGGRDKLYKDAYATKGEAEDIKQYLKTEGKKDVLVFTDKTGDWNISYNEPTSKGMSYAQLKKAGHKLSPHKDSDGDGVKNSKDCRPLDKNKQDINWGKTGGAIAKAGSSYIGKKMHERTPEGRIEKAKKKIKALDQKEKAEYYENFAEAKKQLYEEGRRG